MSHARNEFIGIEHLTEAELEAVRAAFEEAATGKESARHAAIMRMIGRRG